MDLRKLVAQAKRGDEAAFAAFVGETQAEIWRFCAHLVGTNEADDVTQETYLAAWRTISQFRGDAAPRTWLFAIAKRLAARSENKTSRWRELASHNLKSEIANTSDPENAFQVGLAMNALSPERRLALVLTQIFGFSYEEAAQICACSIGTIRSRVARGRRDLMIGLSDHTTKQQSNGNDFQVG